MMNKQHLDWRSGVQYIGYGENHIINRFGANRRTLSEKIRILPLIAIHLITPPFQPCTRISLYLGTVGGWSERGWSTNCEEYIFRGWGWKQNVPNKDGGALRKNDSKWSCAAVSTIFICSFIVTTLLCLSLTCQFNGTTWVPVTPTITQWIHVDNVNLSWNGPLVTHLLHL